MITLSGIPTFLGAPVGDLADIRPGDVGMVGLFYDHSAPDAYGARFAARQLRYASPRPSYETPAGIWDLGDLNVFALEPERHTAALIRQVLALFRAGALPVVIGGAFGAAAILREAAAWHFSDEATGLRTIPEAASNVPNGNCVLTVDLSALSPMVSLHRRPFSALIASIGAVAPASIKAIHVAGMRPELDVTGRVDAHGYAAVLEALIGHLRAGKTA